MRAVRQPDADKPMREHSFSISCSESTPSEVAVKKKEKEKKKKKKKKMEPADAKAPLLSQESSAKEKKRSCAPNSALSILVYSVYIVSNSTLQVPEVINSRSFRKRRGKHVTPIDKDYLYANSNRINVNKWSERAKPEERQAQW